MSLSDHGVAIRDFLEMLEECFVEAVCGRRFVLAEKLKKWLKSSIHLTEGSTTQANRLRHAAHREREGPGIAIEERTIIRKVPLTFSILLKLDHGELINDFKREHITDEQLPTIDFQTLHRRIKRTGTKDADTLARDFDALRWAFIAPKLDLHADESWNKNVILPISKKLEIKKGGTAQLWQIEVLEEFVEEDLRQKIPGSKYDSKDGRGPRYQMALKTFEESNFQIFENEKEAFVGLRGHDGMVMSLGSFRHSEHRGRVQCNETGKEIDNIARTYNILLEYGDFDLDEYFVQWHPPLLPKELREFWEDLFEVAVAVRGVHNRKTPGSTKKYFGWHADIKPENILLVEGKFKLADPGFMKFIEATDKPPEALMDGGTWSYGAPEHQPGRRSPVTQSVDIWSLGCVFSIAATWVVAGVSGTRSFAKIRETAVRALKTQNRLKTDIVGDFFHDGSSVTSEVTSWHDVLRNVARRTDNVTGNVLDLVDQHMLLKDPDKRISIGDLCQKLKLIMSEAREESDMDIPDNILKSLLTVDEQAPIRLSSHPLSPSPVSDALRRESEGKSARKSALLNTPLKKTTHRSESLKSELNIPTKSDEFVVTNRSNPVGREPLDSSVSPHRDSKLPVNRHDRRSVQHEDLARAQSDLSRFSTAEKRSSTARPSLSSIQAHYSAHVAKDVFQARKEMKQSPIRAMIGRQPRDRMLSQHFRGRDIKFLVDNAGSMERYWPSAQYVLETLAMKAAGLDSDGMDLFFTNGGVELRNSNKPSKFSDKMDKPDAEPQGHARTDIRVSMGTIFRDFLKHLYVNSKRKLTLIILTDGVWAAMRSKHDLTPKIVDFVSQVRGILGTLEERPVSIEFVQFGKDPEARYYFRYLDDDLVWEEDIPDVIDFEPAPEGDIYKMLCGSFVEEIDDIPNDEPNMGSPRGPLSQGSSPGSGFHAIDEFRE